MPRQSEKRRARLAILSERRDRPGKHLGQMAAEYKEFYNRVLKRPDEPEMKWSTIWKRGGLTSAHMTNIGNNRAGIDRETGDPVPFDAIPAETVEKVVKGVGVPELRDWFFSANNVESPQELKDRQAEIEQGLRERGFLDKTPPRAARPSKPATTAKPPARKSKSAASRKPETQLVRRRREVPAVVEEAAPYEPFNIPAVPSGASVRTTIHMVDFKMETRQARHAIGSVTITSEGGIDAALQSLFNLGGNNNNGSDQYQEGSNTEGDDSSRQ